MLQQARDIVEAGWVQNRWTASAARRGGRSAGRRRHGRHRVRACVVAAVALAVRARDPRADLAVAHGPGARLRLGRGVRRRPGADRRAGRSAPHHVRVARMRELARWNDERGRTRDDVVAALDRAAARVVAQVVQPARA